MSAKNPRFRYSTGTDDLLKRPFPSMVAGLKDQLKSLSAGIERALTVIEKLESVARIDIECGVDLREEVRRFEIAMIKLALMFTDQHQLRAAELLRLKPTTLNEKIKRYGIS